MLPSNSPYVAKIAGSVDAWDKIFTGKATSSTYRLPLCLFYLPFQCTAPVLPVCFAFPVSDDFVFSQAIGLSLRDLLAHVDEEIQRLDPSSHKEVSLH